MTDYDDTQESLGVASGRQVLEALEEAFGLDESFHVNVRIRFFRSAFCHRRKSLGTMTNHWT
jgi:hypothetical protein